MTSLRLTLLAACAIATPAVAQDHDHHAGMDHSQHAMPQTVEAGGQMRSALGVHPASRDGSGTSWVPQAAPMGGVHVMRGDWMFMGHGLLNGAYIDQGGPRGGEKAFVSGMVGGMAQGPVGPGVAGFRVMLSPDPFMGKSGYPLLLSAGETADGEHVLIDRQHPHDLFMELGASYSVPVGEKGGVFVYGGLPGEPAFGPPAFMHRTSGLDSPEAPISHHWLDSTHVVFGVVTAGFTWDRFKVDASAFRGREPDEKRFDIETGELDSRAVRLSYNPTANWAFQTSWASIESPEALEAHHDERRVSTSAMYARPIGSGGLVSATAAWARKDKVPGDVSNAFLVEAALSPNDAWTVFGRAEQVEQDELGGHGHGPAYTVRRASIGAIRDFRVAEHMKFGIGGLVSAYDIEEPLGATYGDPAGAMAFVRLKIQ